MRDADGYRVVLVVVFYFFFNFHERVEHFCDLLFSSPAVAACGVDNVLVDVSGPEIPIRDGSFRDYVDALDSAGTGPYSRSRPRIVSRRRRPGRL